jgi:hypothetical protein
VADSSISKMPSKASRPKSTAVGRASKRKAAHISSSNGTPVRQSGRVKKALVPPSKRLSKKKRTDSSDEDGLDGDLDAESPSDFEAEDSDAAEATGETDDDNDAEADGPQSYSIPLPKARDAGGQPYEDSRIHPNTFLFLKDLKANNNRDWLKC